MSKANGEIEGNGFFPGASGMLGNNQDISSKKYLILGQDQDSERGFKKSIKLKNEDYSPTWKKLIPFLEQCGINPEHCFFTNCIMGIRENTTKNTGKTPALNHPHFTRQCLDFLKLQIQLIKPESIFVLGIIPSKILSCLSQDLMFRLIFKESIKEMDALDHAVNKNIQFDGIESYTTNVVVLTHPSYRHLNIGNRKYGQCEGEDAEIMMVRSVI